MKRRVLIVAYYFPPLGLGGVQRMHKLAKYLPQCGYDVHVLTVKPVAYPAYDESLLDELPPEVVIHRSGSTDPTRLARLLHLPMSSSPTLKKIAKNKAGLWPDSKIGWRNKAIRKGKAIIDEYDIHVILSSSPPITGHLIAAELSRVSKVPWIADFRDIWESYPPEAIYDDENTIKKSYKLLNEIAHQASAITAVNEMIAKKISPSGVVIPGGFDEDDFTGIVSKPESDTFTFCYLGSVGTLHPIEPILAGFESARNEHTGFRDKARIRIIGRNNPGYIDTLLMQYDFSDRVDIVDYLPHREAVQKASECSAFLLSAPSEYKDILTGKVFDYLALRKPILATVPPDGEAAALIQRHDAGVAVSPDDTSAIADEMISIFEKKQPFSFRNLHEVTRQYTAERFARLFDTVLDGQ
ncbi:MAG: hypothetical protein R3F48_15790 [Candidatus Zixiibacteriota bacterium]